MNCAFEDLRADIQQIQEFLLYGTEEPNIDPRTYKERLESVQNCIITRLHDNFTDSDEYEKMIKLFHTYTSTVEAVYMEIGMQVGMILTAQVYKSLKMAFEGR